MSSLFLLPMSPLPPLPPRTPPQMANPAELFTPDNSPEVPTPPYLEYAPETPASSSYGPAAPESSPLASPPDDTLQTQMPNMRAASDIFLEDRFDISQEDFARSLANIDVDTQGSEDEDGEQYDELKSLHPPMPAHPTSTHALSFSLMHASYWMNMDSLSPHSHGAVALNLDSPVSASCISQYSEGALFGDNDPDKPWVPEDEGWDQVGSGRAATPLAQLLPQLCGMITPTVHADTAARKSAVRRCQQDTGPVPWPESFLVSVMPSRTILSPSLPSSPPSMPQAPASPLPHMAPPLSVPLVTTLEDMLDKGDLPPPRHYPIPYTEDIPMPASPEDDLGHSAFNPAASFDTAAAFNDNNVITIQLEDQGRFISGAMRGISYATSIPMSRLLKGFVDYMEGGHGGHATTMWNPYQEYANRPDNRLVEQLCIDRHFELKEGEEALPLRMQDLSHAWRKFQDSMTEDGLKEFFMLSRKLHAAKNPETLGSCKCKFGKLVDTYNHRLENDFEQFNIQALMVLIGAHVNEDSSVGAVISTGGLVDAPLLHIQQTMISVHGC
ncbi:hypothetical protein B0H17DRAFT_1147232 [Mycena rosella]|uniref:Uncharacterized protein n=1 Tax=Mycena rosella TaxID=1033263 RepID=A0AAD7CM69_MYCRO|nr:hypothetical protein B0H17DRAFT_1147232 [Mycena rosella]